MNQDSTIEEGKLLESWRLGDNLAGNKLVRLHQQALFSFLLSMTRRREQAEDLLQETFLRVFERLADYQEKGRFRSFLFRVGHNLLIDQARIAMRSPQATDEALIELPSSDNPEQAFFAETRSLKLHKALQELSPEQREVVLLHHYAGLTFKEIASIQECSVGTCLGRMHYALLRLKKLVPQEEWSHDLHP